MKTLLLLHRWTGGLIGLLLAMMGVTGTILAVKSWWMLVPGVRDARPQRLDELVRVTDRAFAGADRQGSLVYASQDFGVHQLRLGEDAGAYLDPMGRVVAQWDSLWQRPELWLFDLHHHLLAGDTGELVIAALGLIGMGFVVTGVILWWRTRKTFEWRLWPRRMSRPAVVRHHRDMGVIVAPLLFLTCMTGTMMVMKPFATLLLSPFSSAQEMEAASRPPKGEFGALSAAVRPSALLARARALYPDAEFRILALPRKAGQPITLRVKQPEEWLPNGRTMLWFDPADGRLIGTRDALSLPQGSRLFNMAYPVHSGKVGGILWKLLIVATGLALTLLGTLAVWSFWLGDKKKPRPVRR
jgi:uncharacterized iron-regulated membrane protein